MDVLEEVHTRLATCRSFPVAHQGTAATSSTMVSNTSCKKPFSLLQLWPVPLNGGPYRRRRGGAAHFKDNYASLGFHARLVELKVAREAIRGRESAEALRGEWLEAADSPRRRCCSD